LDYAAVIDSIRSQQFNGKQFTQALIVVIGKRLDKQLFLLIDSELLKVDFAL